MVLLLWCVLLTQLPQAWVHAAGAMACTQSWPACPICAWPGLRCAGAQPAGAPSGEQRRQVWGGADAHIIHHTGQGESGRWAATQGGEARRQCCWSYLVHQQCWALFDRLNGLASHARQAPLLQRPLHTCGMAVLESFATLTSCPGHCSLRETCPRCWLPAARCWVCSAPGQGTRSGRASSSCMSSAKPGSWRRRWWRRRQLPATLPCSAGGRRPRGERRPGPLSGAPCSPIADCDGPDACITSFACNRHTRVASM